MSFSYRGFAQIPYLLPSGRAATGTLSFTPTEPMVNDGLTVAATLRVALVNGLIPSTFQLAATDDPDTDTTTALYRVVERIAGTITTFLMEVSTEDAEIDITTVERLTPVTGATAVYQVLTEKGEPDGYAPLDEIGLLPGEYLNVVLPTVQTATVANGATHTTAADSGSYVDLTLSGATATVAVPTDGSNRQTVEYVGRNASGGEHALTFHAGIALSTGISSNVFTVAADKTIFAAVKCSTLSGSADWTLVAATVST